MERKIITKEQYDDREDRCGPSWNDLPDAPKHTDAEFDEVLELGQMFARQRDLLYKANSVAVARIKELEAKLDALETAKSISAITHILEGEHIQEWNELEKERDGLKAKLENANDMVLVWESKYDELKDTNRALSAEIERLKKGLAFIDAVKKEAKR